MRSAITMLAILGVLAGAGCASGPSKEEKQLTAFITEHLQKVEPLYTQLHRTYWDACLSGDEAGYQKYAQLELEMRTIYSNRDEFAALKRIKESGKVTDPLLARQLNVLYDGYLGNQIDTTLIRQIVELGTAIESRFNTFRGTIDGREVTSNDILEILQTDTNSENRRKAWEASKQVGEAVRDDLVGLVKLRNRAARDLGFPNYYVMSLELSEQDPAEILRIFDELKALTDEPFRQVKAEIDDVLSKRSGIRPEDMRPWHYQDPFFQESPRIYEVDLDQFYHRVDVKDVATRFYTGIGLDPSAILARSDLYEKDKKYPHAYSTDIDRKGDCRVMTNLRNDEYWMDTILHELGHATYSEHADPSLPWLLRSEAHTFTTEAVAEFFGRLAQNAAWMESAGVITPAERKQVEPVTTKSLRLSQMVFARWAQVMVRFERALYENPDQDLNALWWKLVEENQYVHRPEGRDKPDWAAKIHIATSPVYYHNYMLGELLASQLMHDLTADVLKLPEGGTFDPSGHPEVGAYFDERVFKPAARYRWDEMVQRATGEPLTARYFVQQFVSK